LGTTDSIVKGSGDKPVCPDEAITREQLAVILANYFVFSQLGLKNPIDRSVVDDKRSAIIRVA
jgi:hypothetical protein